MKTADMKFVFMDRSDRADDNAEFMYKWTVKHHPEIKCTFLINESCEDWNRLKREGFNLINFRNRTAVEHVLENCTHIIYSQFIQKFEQYRDKYLIFLQHGILFENFSWYINPHIQDFDLMCTTTTSEYEMCMTYPYKVPEKKLVLTGLARHDSLINASNGSNTQKYITIQPHWRNYIDQKDPSNMTSSRFFKGWIALLNDPRIKEIADLYNVKFQFRLHPMCRWCENVFKERIPSYIKFIDPNSNFQKTFVESSLYVTDFSSNAFEVATIGVPCIYFQPDYKDICCRMEDSATKKRTYDYEKGIGPVTYSIEAFIRELIKLLDNDLVLDDIYIKRRDAQFIFKNNMHNCERIFNSIYKITQTNSKLKYENNKKDIRADGQAGLFLYF